MKATKSCRNDPVLEGAPCSCDSPPPLRTKSIAKGIRLPLPHTDATDLAARLEEVTTLASRLTRPGWYAPGQRAAQRRTDTV